MSEHASILGLREHLEAALATLDAEASVPLLAEGSAIKFHDEMGRPQSGTIMTMLPDGRMDVRTDNDIRMTIMRRQVDEHMGAEARMRLGPNGAMAHARKARARKRTATRFAAQPAVHAGATATMKEP